jgi:hypothetical protein
MSGRPETRTTTVGTPERLSAASAARSSASRPSESVRSPTFSAYGVSPTTATATSKLASTPLASLL